MLPDWIIAGAPKCSTSSLFRWLLDHPEVGGSSVKETCYFVDPDSHSFDAGSNVLTGGIAGYEAFFADCAPDAHAIIESTPGYIYAHTALERLPDLASRPSFLFLLREPVAQIRSTFLYFQNNWNWIDKDLDFAQFITLLERGEGDFRGNELVENALSNAMYLDHLLKWRDRVGSERMHVLLFEDLVADQRATMKRVAGMMDIAPEFYDSYEFPRENATYSVRKRWLQDINIAVRGHLPKGRAYDALRSLYRKLNTTRTSSAEARDEETEARLSAYYAPMIPRLEREFGLDLAAWPRLTAMAS